MPCVCFWSFTLEIPRQTAGCRNVNHRFVTLGLLIWHYPSSIYKRHNYSMKLKQYWENKWRMYFWGLRGVFSPFLLYFWRLSGRISTFFTGHTVYCVFLMISMIVHTSEMLYRYQIVCLGLHGSKIYAMLSHSTCNTDHHYAWFVFCVTWSHWVKMFA